MRMIRKQNNFNLPIKPRFPKTVSYPFALISLFVILVCIYSNSFHTGWHLDDYANIVDNSNIHLRSFTWPTITRSFRGIAPNADALRRPLSYLSFAVNYFFNGTDVVGYHVVNFLIHYLNAIVLYLVFCNTLTLPRVYERYGDAAGSIALLAAVLWATHPIQVTAVTYIVQRMTSLAALFYLLGIYFYIKMRTGRRHGWSAGYGVLIFGAFLGASACKENGVMLPISLLMYEFILIRSWEGHRRWLKPLLWMLLSLGVILMVTWQLTDVETIFAGYRDRPFTWQERLMTEPRVLWFYLSLIFYPASFRLTLLHDVAISTGLLTPWTTLPALLGILGVVTMAIGAIRKYPLPAYAILFFLLNHVIESSFIPVELVFEHRNYLPAVFIFLMIAIGMVLLIDYFAYHKGIQFLTVACIIVLIAAQGHTVYYRNGHWIDELSLWQDNAKKSPGLHRPHHNLGKALLVAGRFDEAQKEMQAALEAKPGARVGQKYTTHHNLGVYYMFHQQYDQALVHFMKTLEHIPQHAPTYHDIAKIMLYQDRLPEAHDYIEQAIKRCPDCWEFYLTDSLIRLKTGDADGALEAIAHASQMGATEDRIAYFKGEALRFKGELQRSLYYFERYHSTSPDAETGVIALIELYYLLGHQNKLAQCVRQLICLTDADQRPLGEVLLKFHRETNTLGFDRIKTVVKAIDLVLHRQIKRLDTLLSEDAREPQKERPAVH
jgi:tetratricopeptide (TPR) repeat protein